MTPLAAGLVGLLTLADAAPDPHPSCRCPCPPAAASTLLPRPTPDAFALNGKGRELYRQRRFAEARLAYEAALQRDPSFVAPRLNIACAFAQEERFADAVTAAAALAEVRYVPWGREIERAADLAPLRVRPEERQLRAALATAATGWGAALASPGAALLFVARSAPPVRLPPAGVLVLGLAQEIHAYLPATGSYRQVTAEDGRVLAFVRAPDGQSLIYVTGGKVIRAPGQPDLLRGLAVRRLDLPRMALGPSLALEGDLRRVGLRFGPQPSLPSLHLAGADGKQRVLLLDGEHLVTVPQPAAARFPAPSVELGTRGVLVAPDVRQAGACAFTARGARGAGTAGAPTIRLDARGRSLVITAPEGVGLAGLPFP